MEKCGLETDANQRIVTLERILRENQFPKSSFLGYPLLQHALLDPHFQIKKLGVDANWLYYGFFEGAVSGYNPLNSACYYSQNSVLETWFANPFVDSRDLNEGEHLVYELLSLVHDWLHNWTYRVVEQNFPCGMGRAEITSDNFEDFVFIHILSEAVARLGQDYWLLSERDLNTFVDVGSIISPLFTNYRKHYLGEFRKFNPDFTVQDKGFFWKYLHLNCTGEFEGFGKGDMDRSPALLHWAHHELEISDQLRFYTRQWLSYLSQGKIKPDKISHAPCEYLTTRHKEMAAVVQEALWSEIMLGKRQALPLLPTPSWTAQGMPEIDFRFVNLGAWKQDVLSIEKDVRVTDSFDFFYRQFVSRHDFMATPPQAKGLVHKARQYKDVALLYYLFKDVPFLSLPDEPYDLYFIN